MPDTTTYNGEKFERTPFESLLRRRFFFGEAFELYRTASGFTGDNKGLFDYGPPGCALQANIVDLWRKHFVLEEDMSELDCTVLTPEDVFKTSGHVDKFADWMCKDPVTGDYLRADHLVENVLELRLKGNLIARGTKMDVVDSRAGAESGDAKKKKMMKNKQAAAVRLEDQVVKEYEEILAKAGTPPHCSMSLLTSHRLIIMTEMGSEI